MIVVDGRTDAEKLQELLRGGAEETELDFKQTVDLRDNRHAVEFAKDCISMMNLPQGGFLVVGVTDDGRVAHDAAPVDLRQFDPSKLRDAVARYVEAPVHIYSQAHRLENRDVVLIFIRPGVDALPVPISKQGQYEKAGQDGKRRSEVVFSEGDVLIREGTSNVRLRYSHWNILLAEYRRRVQAEARRDTDELVRQFITRAASLPLGAGPVLLEMDHQTFADALVAALDAPTTTQIQTVIHQAVAVAAAKPPIVDPAALDKLAIIAILAARYDRVDVYDLAIQGLIRIYDSLPPDSVSSNAVIVGAEQEQSAYWLALLLRLFAIGSFVVRQGRWSFLPALVNHPVAVSSTYRYESWLRHGSVYASRAGLLQADDQGREVGGQLLSRSLELIIRTPQLRPDVLIPPTQSGVAQVAGEQLLNSLCQFDMWWCVMAQVHSTRQTGFFPSCAALHQYRAQPAMDRIATDEKARTQAFPGVSTTLIATCLDLVIRRTVQLSDQYGGYWDGLDSSPAVAQFLGSHRT